MHNNKNGCIPDDSACWGYLEKVWKSRPGQLVWWVRAKREENSYLRLRLRLAIPAIPNSQIYTVPTIHTHTYLGTYLVPLLSLTQTKPSYSPIHYLLRASANYMHTVHVYAIHTRSFDPVAPTLEQSNSGSALATGLDSINLSLCPLFPPLPPVFFCASSSHHHHQPTHSHLPPYLQFKGRPRIVDSLILNPNSTSLLLFVSSNRRIEEEPCLPSCGFGSGADVGSACNRLIRPKPRPTPSYFPPRLCSYRLIIPSITCHTPHT